MMQATDWAKAKCNIEWYQGHALGAISAWFATVAYLDIENEAEIYQEYRAMIIPDYKRNKERA
ncbi:hypothetical protein Dtox_3715 [Desulfofarcimen acetoxidans DSM 771]|uniref:Uncharacterized protein n=1 Tax=Desulfofarcimen acetoxidans (strain ATCC 49208 / DSM 771 / KCTC 5769 / VKM B-1644 / 5575) TaxID=485916 RepID=C8VWQ9_DESAS|nr:hypothetical protein [Desulfofarcimen acetoxidans]ACV64423.1 hypothetical protein Dtox_3715 [Desulfofarcimen acetoxidans DSM 771]